MPTVLYRLRNLLCLAVSLAVLPCIGCDPKETVEPSGESEDAARIIAINYPLTFLTERIAGDVVSVECIVPSGQNAREWKPDREAIKRLQAAKLIIVNGRGAEYATWLTKASLPESKLCETATRGLSLQDYIAVEDIRIVHSHGPEGEHSHPTMVAYSWLDPAIAKKQARYIAAELSRLYPESQSIFEKNESQLGKELDNLTATLDPLKSTGDMVLTTNSHLKFLTRAAGLTDAHFNWSNETSEDQAKTELSNRLKELGRKSESNGSDPPTKLGPRIVLTTPQLNDALNKMVEGEGFRIVSIDTLDVYPDGGSYLDVMKDNIAKLSESLSPAQ